jgi:hypothetical protein
MARTPAKSHETQEEPYEGPVHPSLASLRVRLDTVSADPRNARKHSAANIEAIKRSLNRWGQRQPLVARSSDRTIVAGNGRLEAMLALGWEEAAVIFVEEAHDESAGYAIADNRTAELAEWDSEQLAETMKALGEMDFGGIDSLGFTSDEIDAFSGDTFKDTPEKKPREERPAKEGDLVIPNTPMLVACFTEARNALIVEWERAGNDPAKIEDADVVIAALSFYAEKKNPKPRK